jgi:hypothetical protein
MGRDEENARGDAGIFDGFHSFRQAGASAGRGRELRVRRGYEKQTKEQNKRNPRALVDFGRQFVAHRRDQLRHLIGLGRAKPPH